MINHSKKSREISEETGCAATVAAGVADRLQSDMNAKLAPFVTSGKFDEISDQLRSSIKRFETSFGFSPSVLSPAMREAIIDDDGLVIPAPRLEKILPPADENSVTLGDDGDRWDAQLHLYDK